MALHTKLYDRMSKESISKLNNGDLVSKGLIDNLKRNYKLTEIQLHDAIVINDTLIGGDLNYNKFSDLFNGIKNK